MKEIFLQMISDHEGIIYKISRMYCDSKQDREDLFQDIVYQLWRSYPTFKEESKPSTWIYKVALNVAVSGFRKGTKSKGYEDINEESLQIPYALADQEKEEKVELMNLAIGQLSHVEKALMLLYLDAHSYKEISEVLGITESNVGFKINKIKGKLKSIINSYTNGIRRI